MFCKSMMVMPSVAALAAMAKVAGLREGQRGPKRPCITCQKPHNHNNAFCSKECCAGYQNSRQLPNT